MFSCNIRFMFCLHSHMTVELAKKNAYYCCCETCMAPIGLYTYTAAEVQYGCHRGQIMAYFSGTSISYLNKFTRRKAHCWNELWERVCRHIRCVWNIYGVYTFIFKYMSIYWCLLRCCCRDAWSFISADVPI